MASSVDDNARAAEPSPARGAAREKAILDAALELIREVGYERVTVDAIAARAGSSKTTMYRRWPDKAGLVADALRRQAQGEAPEVPETRNLRDDLLAVVTQIAGTLVGDAGPSLLGLLGAIRDDRTLREIIRFQVRERSHEVGRVISARAAARGDEVDPRRAEAVIDIAFAQLFSETLFHGGIPKASFLAQLVDDVLLPVLRRSTS